MSANQKVIDQAPRIGKKLRLLIIEDSEYDAELMVHLLRKNNVDLDYHLITSSQQMKSHLSEFKYDIVISDFNLPGFSGIDALKIAKDHDTMLPFILISGLISQDQETEILEFGADEVILKTNLNRLPFAVRRVSYEVEDKRKMKTLISTKDKLISVIAHDIRGTLEGIQVLTEHMNEDIGKESETKSLKESLDLIGQSARSTNQLLENLLNWALLQLGSFQPSLENFDLQVCMQEAIDFNSSKAAGKGIKIDLKAPPVKIQGDCNMLSIVFRNLISNAIKFSDAHDRIETEVRENEEETLISVSDHGIGIPDDLLEKLFDPDDRPTRPGTHQEQSSGLGLLLSNDAVKMHGGSITVHSEEGKGSTFIVHLPKKPCL